MGVIQCPHCGKEMFEQLTVCPHCGGPVVSEAQVREIKEATEIFCDEINKKEKKWLFISLGAGIAFFVLVLIMFIGPVFTTEDVGFFGRLVALLIFLIAMIIVGYMIAGGVYGCHLFHPVKRFSWALLLPGAGIIIAGIIGFLVGVCGGTYYWLPRALYRYFKKKPLLTVQEITKLVEKELI